MLVLAIVAAAFVAALFVDAGNPTQSALFGTAWTMPGFDASGGSQSAFVVASPIGTLQWRRPDFSATNRSVLLTTSLAKQQWTKKEEEKGEEEMRYRRINNKKSELGPLPQSSSASSSSSWLRYSDLLERPSAAVDTMDGVIWQNQTHYMRSAYNGTLLWSFPCPLPSYSVAAPTLITDPQSETLVAVAAVCVMDAGSGSFVFVLDLATGQPTGKRHISGTALTPPMVDVANGFVLVGTEQGEVRAMQHATPGLDDYWHMSGVAIDGSAIRGAPCSDGVSWFVFTFGGSAAAIVARSGTLLWNKTVTLNPRSPGFVAGCSILHSAGHQFVAAGALDFHFYVIMATDGSSGGGSGDNDGNANSGNKKHKEGNIVGWDLEAGTVVCTGATLSQITEGAATYNGSFVVASRDGSVYAFLPTPASCLCLFAIKGFYGPTRPIIDGHYTLVVADRRAVSAFDLRQWFIAPLIKPIWTWAGTGEAFNAPIIGPHGVVYATTEEGGLLAIGLTSGFLQHHTRDLAMVLATKPADAQAIAQLAWLCLDLGNGLGLDSRFAAALNETCRLFWNAKLGRDPSGFASHYADWSDPAVYVSRLTLAGRLLSDVTLDVASLSAAAATLDQQLKTAHGIVSSSDDRLVALTAQLKQTEDLLRSAGLTVVGIQVQLVAYDAVLKQVIPLFAKQWIAAALNFAHKALNDMAIAEAEFQAAMGDISSATSSILNPFAWGSIGGDLSDAVDELRQGVAHAVATLVDIELAERYLNAWLNLEQVWGFFNKTQTINAQLMQNNQTFPEVYPELFTQAVTIEKAKFWLQRALAAMEALVPGVLVANALEGYVANTEALIAADLAYYFIGSQRQAKLAAIVALRTDVGAVRADISAEFSQRAAIAAAYRVATSQQYVVQFETLAIARRACQQFEYWALKACIPPLASYPSVQDLDRWTSDYQAAVAAQVPYRPPKSNWVQIAFNRSSNPEVFAYASASRRGSWLLNAAMPSNPSWAQVRAFDYRVWWWPLTCLDPDADAVHPRFTHFGVSRFLGSSGSDHSDKMHSGVGSGGSSSSKKSTSRRKYYADHQVNKIDKINNNVNYNNSVPTATATAAAATTVWTFTQPLTSDFNSYYQPQTKACPVGDPHDCTALQCSTTWNVSPYGSWLIELDSSYFVGSNVDCVQSIVLQFHVLFDAQSSRFAGTESNDAIDNDDNHKSRREGKGANAKDANAPHTIIFAGGDGGKQFPADMCATNER